VFPNPAVAPNSPTIRACLGTVDSAEFTIFDIAGRLVGSASVPGASSKMINGQYCYDYPWVDGKASGVYFYVVHGKAADGTIVRGKGKFAVVQ